MPLPRERVPKQESPQYLRCSDSRCPLGRSGPHFFSDGLVVAIDLPLGYRPILNYRSPSCGRFPLVPIRHLPALRDIRAPSRPNQNHHIPVRHKLINFNPIVRNHSKVLLPSCVDSRARRSVPQGIDKNEVARHDSDDALVIMGIDCVNKPLSDACCCNVLCPHAESPPALPMDALAIGHRAMRIADSECGRIPPGGKHVIVPRQGRRIASLFDDSTEAIQEYSQPWPSQSIENSATAAISKAKAHMRSKLNQALRNIVSPTLS